MVKSYRSYAFTISPPPGQFNFDRVIDFITEQPKYVYVFELGKQGNHKHLHAWVEFSKDTRKDSVISRLQTRIYKAKDQMPLDPTNDGILFKEHVKFAYNPSYFINDYCTKDGKINHSDNVDLQFHKEQSKIVQLLHETKKLRVVNLFNFRTLYREWRKTNPIVSIKYQICEDIDGNLYHEERVIRSEFSPTRIIRSMEESMNLDMTSVLTNMNKYKILMLYEDEQYSELDSFYRIQWEKQLKE